MLDQQRNTRVRKLVHNLNRSRKKQAQKIDILCNDFVSAQRKFLHTLDTCRFAADFYESILGENSIGELFIKAGETIRKEIEDLNIKFVLRTPDDFEIFDSGVSENGQENMSLEKMITHEIVENICTSNKLCGLNDMLKMGLQISPTDIKNISAFAVPLSIGTKAYGFILLYRLGGEKIASWEVQNIMAVTSGLSKAVNGCLCV